MNVIELTQALINLPSITPEGADCIELIIARLEKLNFHIERIPVGPAQNLWARYGSQSPVVCFLGHVDVVPPGPLEQWITPPFSATVRDGYLYGRGASDMKSGIAAFIIAIENFIQAHPDFPGSIAVMLTTVEEEEHQHGVPNIVELLTERGEKIDYCITGEPSSEHSVGDRIRHGRRGSLNGKLTIIGKQGHIATPQLADNPIHRALPALAELAATAWDQGNADFPPTSFQISNIHAGTGALNVIPGHITLDLNFRFCPESTAEQLQQRVETILQKYPLHYDLQWSLSGNPFYTAPGRLRQAVAHAIKTIVNITPEFSTGGGTSDARFIAPMGAEVIELGVSNATAHKINECAKISDIEALVDLYQLSLTTLFAHVTN